MKITLESMMNPETIFHSIVIILMKFLKVLLLLILNRRALTLNRLAERLAQMVNLPNRITVLQMNLNSNCACIATARARDSFCSRVRATFSGGPGECLCYTRPGCPLIVRPGFQRLGEMTISKLKWLSLLALYMFSYILCPLDKPYKGFLNLFKATPERGLGAVSPSPHL